MPDSPDKLLAVDYSCPKCHETVVFPPRFSFWRKYEEFLECESCQTKLKPIYCAEKRLLVYFLFSSISAAWFGLIFLLNLWFKSPVISFAIAWFPLNYCFRKLLFQIQKRCFRYFIAATKQWSLLDAVYATLAIGSLLGFFLTPAGDKWRIGVGVYVLVGVIEIARCIAIKRSNGKLS
jgi:hypothetical protein